MEDRDGSGCSGLLNNLGMQNKFEFDYESYNNSSELTKEDQELLAKARAVTAQAYAPYSQFYVGAIARLKNGQLVAGIDRCIDRRSEAGNGCACRRA